MRAAGMRGLRPALLQASDRVFRDGCRRFKGQAAKDNLTQNVPPPRDLLRPRRNGGLSTLPCNARPSKL
jgi:hypothetical protein